MIRLILLFLLPSFFVRAADSSKDQCLELLKSAGASEIFGMDVGHAIHSMTVRALKNTTEAILPNAPDRKEPSAEMFISEGMKTLDEFLVLNHMDDPKYDVTFYSPLERVVHAFHMEEVWAQTKEVYDKLKENPPSDEVCKCAMDVENNGVLKMLRFSALAIREPELIYGDHLEYYKKTDLERKGYIFTNPSKLRMLDKERRKMGMSAEQMLMKRVEAMPRLNDAASWQKWKAMMKMTMNEHKNIAIFLYCALNGKQ